MKYSSLTKVTTAVIREKINFVGKRLEKQQQCDYYHLIVTQKDVKISMLKILKTNIFHS